MKILRFIFIMCVALAFGGLALSSPVSASNISERYDYTYKVITDDKFWDLHYVPHEGKYKPFKVEKVIVSFNAPRSFGGVETTTLEMTEKNPVISHSAAVRGVVDTVDVRIQANGRNYKYHYKPSNYSEVQILGDTPIHSTPEYFDNGKVTSAKLRVKLGNPSICNNYYFHKGVGHADGIYRITGVKVIVEENKGDTLEATLTDKNPSYDYTGSKDIKKVTLILQQSDGETVKKVFKNPDDNRLIVLSVSEEIKIYEGWYILKKK